MSNEDVLIGTVVKPHGVDGTLLVEILTDFPGQRFAPGESVRLQLDGSEQIFTVEAASPHGERWRIKLEQCSDRDRAEQLREAEIVVSEDEVLGEGDELYDFDLVGMEVLDTNGNRRGTIEAVSYSGSRPLLEIEPPRGDRFDFPAHEQLVDDFDRGEGWIRLRFPRGWDS